MEQYQEWIQLVAEFTVSSLNSWQWASGSIHYLLGLWSRLVSSSAYLKGESPSLLETYAPKIIEAYITSRCDSINTQTTDIFPHLFSSIFCCVAHDECPTSKHAMKES